MGAQKKPAPLDDYSRGAEAMREVIRESLAALAQVIDHMTEGGAMSRSTFSARMETVNSALVRTLQAERPKDPQSSRGRPGYRQLYCAGSGSGFRFAMAPNKKSATGLLGGPARQATSSDVRRIWISEKLHEQDPEKVRARFGISRGTLYEWEKRVGSDVPKYRHVRRRKAKERTRSSLDPSLTLTDVAKAARTSVSVVREVAQETGVVLATRQFKIPKDEEIVRLAKGRTWKELAEACNVVLPTLQNHVYASPKLSRKVRSVIRLERGMRGKMDADRIVRLYLGGKSAYRIARELGIAKVTVAYWLKKRGVYRGKMGSTEDAESV